MTVQEMPSAIQLEQILLGLTVPDTNAIRAASATLRSVLSRIACIERLLQVLASSQDAAARQLAAVYLRKRIGAYWIKLQPIERRQLQSILLQQLVNEQARPVKIGIAGVVTVVARYTLSSNEWPELMPFLEQMCQPSSSIRELALRIFRVLSQNSMKTLRPFANKLCSIFATGLADGDVAVRLEALKAMGTLVQLLEEKDVVVWIQSVLSPMVNAMRSCVSMGEWEAAVGSLEVLEQLVEEPTDVLGDQLPALTATVLALVRARETEMEVRSRAGCLIAVILERRPMQIAAEPKLLQELLSASLHLMLEGCSDDDEDEDEQGARGIAVQILDAAMLNLPVESTYRFTITSVGELLRSNAPVHRRAGLYALMVMTEGAADAMRPDFNALLQLVLAGLADQDAAVRESACIALGQFADHLADLLVANHVGAVLNAIFQCLDRSDQSDAVKRKLCLSLESLCPEVGDALKPYLSPLVQRLLTLLHSPNDALQQAAISAIAATASAAEEAFLPYFNDSINLISTALNQTAEEYLPMRAKATWCIGCIAAAVGSSLVAPMSEALMRQSLMGFQLASCELRESTFNFWSLFARVLGTGFEPYLQTVVDLAIATIDSNDGMQIRGSNADLDAEFGACGDGDDDVETDESESLEEDESGEGGRVHCSILSGFLDEKVAAVDCLGAAMKYGGKGVVPHLQRVVNTLELITDYPHHFVQGSVIRSFHQCVDAVHVLFPGATPGTISSETNALLDRFVPALVVLMTDEDSRDVVAGATDTLLALLKDLGGSFLALHLPDILTAISTLLNNEGLCQQFDQDSSRDVVLESVCDLIGGLAQTMGASFVATFAGLAPKLSQRFAQATEEISQSVILGCFGEVLAALGESSAQYASSVAPLALSSIGSGNDRLRRNAAFCLGSLFSSLPKAMALSVRHEALPVLTNALAQPIAAADNNSRDLAARDNVVSALAKLVRAVGGEGIDMNMILCMLLENTPLHYDMDENEFVYPVLLDAFRAATSAQQSLPRFVHVLASALADARVQENVKSTIGNELRSLLQKHGSNAKLEALGAAQQQAVQALMR